ncbi:hypothetical protein [Halobacillus massiliensis]|uniref:hypothetical protein n=1 Tax=Halobacillus massiliensis TaxID=1926286 RepID=UPI0015C4D101|nr:hypothetical protein [Halobacillus massiliensis]
MRKTHQFSTSNNHHPYDEQSGNENDHHADGEMINEFSRGFTPKLKFCCWDTGLK